MKKMTLFIGSPRKNGNTAQLAPWLSENAGTEIEPAAPVFLYDYNIQTCG